MSDPIHPDPEPDLSAWLCRLCSVQIQKHTAGRDPDLCRACDLQARMENARERGAWGRPRKWDRYP